LLKWKGDLLTRLGDYAGAEKALNQAAELSGSPSPGSELNLKIAEGQLDAAMDILETMQYLTAAELRLEPDYDPLRGLPRFKSLLERAQSDPNRAPQAPKGSASSLSSHVSQN
ncbi:MAG TPA: hypothetical protein VGG37_09075, partial [Opitutaceae bacterium]